jgi:hypothetical protein
MSGRSASSSWNSHRQLQPVLRGCNTPVERQADHDQSRADIVKPAEAAKWGMGTAALGRLPSLRTAAKID